MYFPVVFQSQIIGGLATFHIDCGNSETMLTGVNMA